jgi:hypothetical protein
MAPAPEADALRRRNLVFLHNPYFWPLWPLLPLVRRTPPGVETLGVLVDVKGFFGRDEDPWHVFLDNVLRIPMTLSELAASPGESFPSAEELFASGWRVD